MREANGSDGFAFASGCRGGSRNENEFAAAPEGRIGEEFEPDFSDVTANLFDVLFGNLQFASYVLNREKCSGHVGECRRCWAEYFGVEESTTTTAAYSRQFALMFAVASLEISFATGCGSVP